MISINSGHAQSQQGGLLRLGGAGKVTAQAVLDLVSHNRSGSYYPLDTQGNNVLCVWSQLSGGAIGDPARKEKTRYTLPCGRFAQR